MTIQVQKGSIVAPKQTDRRLILVMCLTQITGMLGFVTFPALLPGFIASWDLSNTEAGWLNGVMFAGYMAAVPLLMAWTDRSDARNVFLASCIVTALALAGFAIAADGFWSALVLRALMGIGLAGTYMPGLKLLTDRLQATEQSRAVAFYTATYGIGTALSFYLSGELAGLWGWRTSFAVIATGSILSFALVLAFTRPQRKDRAHVPSIGATLDFRPVFRNRRAIAYIIAYTLHTGELMAMLSWIVAFLTYAGRLSDGAMDPTIIIMIGSAVALIALPMSILGNEGAVRFGRRRFISLVMVSTAIVSCFVGFSAAWSFAAVVLMCLLYGALIATDSASLTAGTVAAAQADRQGATIALHSFLGFGGGFLWPLLFGVILDVAGGRDAVTAWGIAFAVMGLTTLLGPLVLARWGDAPQPAALSRDSGSTV